MLYGREGDYTSVTTENDTMIFSALDLPEACRICGKPARFDITLPWIKTIFGVNPSVSLCDICLTDLGADLMALAQAE